MNLNEKRQIVRHFWRRLAAAWVDVFVIYVISLVLTTITFPFNLRIPIESLFVIVGAIYSSLLLSFNGQTIGKMLLNYTVIPLVGGKLSLRQVLLRECVGKWGICVTLPIILGRLLLRNVWIPTVFDILILLPVFFFLFIHYLIAKRPLYDQLAGTTVEKVLVSRKSARTAFVALLGIAVLGTGLNAFEYVMNGWIPCRLALWRSMNSTKKYVTFLKRGQAEPVDYVISLFDKYDVVVLCERSHPEITQWDFIWKVVSDPRFIQRVGHISTECGQLGMQTYLDTFMNTDGLTDSEINERAIHIMRNFSIWPTWTKTNFYTYLKRLYLLNQTLPPTHRIQHSFTDAPVDWTALQTPKQWKTYLNYDRDKRMAQSIIEEMEKRAKSESIPPKCLVIMNYTHAFDLTGRLPKAHRQNTFEYLKDAFGNRTANVLLNTDYLCLGLAPVLRGVWDRAFKETDNRPAGFDFKSSPFGEDSFDYFPFKKKFKYQDIFTGFVFINPLEDQLLEFGIPGYYNGFESEFIRRAGLLGESSKRMFEDNIEKWKSRKVPSRENESDIMLRFGTHLEIYIFAFLGVGVLIGTGAFIFGKRRDDNPYEVNNKMANLTK